MKKKPGDTKLESLLQRGYRYAFSLTHEESAARDLLHDACLSILKGDKPLHIGYLLTCVRNKYIDGRRREMKVEISSLSGETEDTLATVDNVFKFDERFAEDPEILNEALASLRDIEREALYLSAVEGYTVKEIGKLTGHSRGTISSLLFRARRKAAAFYSVRIKKEGT